MGITDVNGKGMRIKLD